MPRSATLTRTTSRSKSVPPGEQGESPAPLAARIEELEKGLRAILDGHLLTVLSGRRACCVCSPQDGRWPCPTVLEARTALGGEDG